MTITGTSNNVLVFFSPGNLPRLFICPTYFTFYEGIFFFILRDISHRIKFPNFARTQSFRKDSRGAALLCVEKSLCDFLLLFGHGLIEF